MRPDGGARAGHEIYRNEATAKPIAVVATHKVASGEVESVAIKMTGKTILTRMQL